MSRAGFDGDLVWWVTRSSLRAYAVAGDLAKMVAMEKEVFACRDSTGNLTQVKDVETFMEIVERALGTDGVKTTIKRVESYTCLKDFATGTIGCSAQVVPQVPLPVPHSRVQAFGAAGMVPVSTTVRLWTADGAPIIGLGAGHRSRLMAPHGWESCDSDPSTPE